MRSDREKNKFPWFDETRPLADRIEEAWSALYVALTNPRISRIYMAANGKVKEQHDDSRAVLIIVENGNIAGFFETLFHLKAAGGADVFKVDASKASRNEVYRAYYLVHVL